MMLFINEANSSNHILFKDSSIILKNGDNELPINMEPALLELIRKSVNSADSSILVFPEQGAIVEDGTVKICASEDAHNIIIRVTKMAARYEQVTGNGSFSSSSPVERADGDKMSLKIQSKKGIMSVEITGKNDCGKWSQAPSEEPKGFEESYRGLSLHYWAYAPNMYV